MPHSIKRTPKRTSRSTVRRLGYETVPIKDFDAAPPMSAAVREQQWPRSPEEGRDRVLSRPKHAPNNAGKLIAAMRRR
ncbi:MAG: hypothetical protein JWL84_4260 [Rhodospirillales bacterium]|jgi:hypothetical protein|nr:hypothetical protein [Rhodospirillales bacterium]